MACKTDSPVSSSSYSSGDEADSTQADAHTSVADSDCNTAIKVINKLMPSMMELIHLEIDVVLSKAYSAGFVGKEMLDKGIKNDPKQVARQFMDAACTQIEMNFDIKFKAFLDIFRDIASLEIIAHKIEDEIMKTQKPKLKKKRKRKNKKLPKSNVAPEACSYSSGFDEISTTITTGDYLPTPPQQVLNKSVATENPSGDQNSGILMMVSIPHSGTVTHSNTGIRTFNETPSSFVSEKERAMEVITMLTPDIVEVCQHEISDVLDKARSAKLIGEDVYSKYTGENHNPKQIARDFLASACSQIKVDFNAKFKALLKIFHDTASLEFLEKKIEDEMRILEARERDDRVQSSTEPDSYSAYSVPYSASLAQDYPGSLSSEQKGDYISVPSISKPRDAAFQECSTLQSFPATRGSNSEILVSGKSIEEVHSSNTRTDQIAMELSSTKRRSKNVECYKQFQELLDNEREEASLVMEESNEVLSQIQAEQQQIEHDQMAHLQDVTKKHNIEVQRRKLTLQSYMEYIQKKEKEMEEVKRIYEGRLSELKRKHEDKIKNMEDAHRKEVDDKKEEEEKRLSRQYETRMEDMMKSVESERRNVKLAEEKLIQKYQFHEQMLVLDYERKLSKQKNSYKKRISELKKDHDLEEKKIETMLTQLKQQMEEKDAKNRELQWQLEEKEARYREAELKRQLNEKEARIREAELKHQIAVGELKLEYERRESSASISSSNSTSKARVDLSCNDLQDDR